MSQSTGDMKLRKDTVTVNLKHLLDQRDAEIADKDAQIAEKDAQIIELQGRIHHLLGSKSTLYEQNYCLRQIIINKDNQTRQLLKLKKWLCFFIMLIIPFVIVIVFLMNLCLTLLVITLMVLEQNGISIHDICNLLWNNYFYHGKISVRKF